LLVAFCHRCKWTANVFALARELGLLAGDPKLREKLSREALEHRRQRAEEEKFDAWRNERIRQLSAQRRSVWRNAGLAHEVLQKYPDCESAWDSLARWYNAEARLSATLDYLTFTKASQWLEVDSSREEVLEMWRQDVRAA